MMATSPLWIPLAITAFMIVTLYYMAESLYYLTKAAISYATTMAYMTMTMKIKPLMWIHTTTRHSGTYG